MKTLPDDWPDDGPQPTVLPDWLYDRAKAAGNDMAGYIRQERMPAVDPLLPNVMLGRYDGVTIRHADPVAGMNRKQRRSMMRTTGRTWAQARELSKKRDRDAENERAVVKAAAKLTPAEARKALAEWAARGGK